MKTAIAYLRVSTSNQANDGVSLDVQEAKLRAWCLLNDYELAHIFVDAGISGHRADNRPALQQALSACKKSSALVVYSLSRLSRSTTDTIAISERLEKQGVDLVSLSEKIDTTTAAGKMVFRLLAVLAEFERDQIVERVSAAMSHKKNRGERVGAIPYGFQLGDDGVALIPNSQEQAIVDKARQMNERGMSLRQIAKQLASNGYLARNGELFQATQIKRMIANG